MSKPNRNPKQERTSIHPRAVVPPWLCSCVDPARSVIRPDAPHTVSQSFLERHRSPLHRAQQRLQVHHVIVPAGRGRRLRAHAPCARVGNSRRSDQHTLASFDSPPLSLPLSHMTRYHE